MREHLKHMRHNSYALSRNEYQTLLEQSSDAIVIMNVQEPYILIGQQTCALLGYSSEEVLNLTWPDEILADRTTTELFDFSNLRAGETLYGKGRMRGKNDNVFDVAIRAYREASDYVLVYIRPVSKQMASDAAPIKRASFVQQSDEQLYYQNTVLQNIPDAIVATDLQFMITSWNPAAEALYGWRADEAIGRSSEQMLRTVYIDIQREQAIQHIFRHGHWEGGFIQQHKNNTTLMVMTSIALVRDNAGKPIGTVAVNRTVGERNSELMPQPKAERQLYTSKHTQEVEDIGQLVAGIAHNFNNLLTVILGYCDLISTQLTVGDPLRDDLKQIQHASDRAARITQQLLAFGRKQLLEPTMLNLNKLIANMVVVLEQLLGAHISLTIDLEPQLWSITADPEQLQHVIINLVLNARDAMPNGGLLSITTRNITAEDRDAPAWYDASYNPGVVITVTDTGRGMDAQTQAQLFKPFFTTKLSSQGTGLGLASSYGIVMQSGGMITVDSELGFGSTFTIYLPRSKQLELALAQ